MTAAKICKFGPGNGSRPPITTAIKKGMLASAECMRSHGVPTFQDPVFPAAGGIENRGAPGVSRDSPAFQRAASECRHAGVGLPGGG